MAEQASTFSWTVPLDHPALAGHFPGNPIVPGVVLLDRVILFAEQFCKAADSTESTHPCRWRVDSAKFLHAVGPGETLSFKLQTRPSGGLTFTVRSATHEVAGGRLSRTP